MDFLLDTHIAVWYLQGDQRISLKVREIVANPRNRIYYSIISMWEVALKHTVNAENMSMSGTAFLHWCEQAGFEKLPLDDRHVCALETLQQHLGPDGKPVFDHKDPFDRILLAQAKGDGMTLLTHDIKFKFWDEPYYQIV